MGNTLVIVEHDEDTMHAGRPYRISDLELNHCGELVAQGTVDDIKACKESITDSSYPVRARSKS